MNDIIFNWLKGFPGMELLQRQQVDAAEGACGLFFCGVTEDDRSYDLLGACRRTKTLRFRLSRYGQREESPLFFLLLENWVQVNARYLGADHTAALKKACCVRDTDSGLVLWEADLEIRYREEL